MVNISWGLLFLIAFYFSHFIILMPSNVVDNVWLFFLWAEIRAANSLIFQRYFYSDWPCMITCLWLVSPCVDPPRFTALTLAARCCALAPAADIDRDLRPAPWLRQSSCTSLLLSIDRADRRTGGHRTVTSILQGLNKLWNFEARACIGLQKNLDFSNKNVRLVIRTPFQKLRY